MGLDDFRREAEGEFPNKGKYRLFARDWTPTGYAEEAQYAGQQPIRFPEHWPACLCLLVGLSL